MRRRLLLLLVIGVVSPLLAWSFARSGPGVPPASLAGSHEGVFEYLPPQRGQSIAVQGRFVYLHGPSDTTRPMRAYGGTYSVSGDTITNTILYDTDPKGVGRSFRWMVTATSGDTVEFGILNAAGQVTSRGRSLLRR